MPRPPTPKSPLRATREPAASPRPTGYFPASPKSIRWQIQLWHGAILVGVVVGLLILAILYESRQQVAHVDVYLQGLLPRTLAALHPGGPDRPPRIRQIQDPLDEALGMPPPDGPGENMRERDRKYLEDQINRGTYYILWDSEGERISASRNAPALTRPDYFPRPGDSRLVTREGYREVHAFTPRDGLLLMGAPLSRAHDELWAFAGKLSLLGAAIIGFGLAGGWWLSGHAIRPISEISRTAREIAHGDLSKRIDVGDSQNEFAELAHVLNDTFARLQASFEQQVQFSSDASHELRTPLSVILAQTQLALSKERTPAEYQKALEVCRKHAETMRDLVNSLLELARTDSVKESLHVQRTDLAALARDTVKLMEAFASERQIDLSFHGTSTLCRVDEEKMRRVITNLVSNAINYNRPGGAVRVYVRKELEECVLTVADTGIGIAPQHVPHLFERFYRTDKSRSRSIGGTGLGLAICRTFVEAHEGTIAVESEPGKGSIFTVRLPC